MPDEPKPFRCGICEQLRECDTNHWWIVRVRLLPGSRNRTAASTAGWEYIELLPWNSALARHKDCTLACGLRCLTTAAGRAAEKLVRDSVVAQVAPPLSGGRPEALSEKSEPGENEHATDPVTN